MAIDRDAREQLLLQQIERTPGASLRQLQRYTELPLSSVVRILSRLEADGRVRSETRRSYRAFFPAKQGLHARERLVLNIISKPRPRALLETILERPGLRQVDLANQVGLPKPTVTYYMKQLIAADLVTERRAGIERSYRIKNPAMLRKALSRTANGFTPELA